MDKPPTAFEHGIRAALHPLELMRNTHTFALRCRPSSEARCALQLALRVSVPVAAALWAAGCGGPQPPTVTARLTERQVLELLYDELDGDNWGYKPNWLTDRPLDEWYGVGTDASGRVDWLDIGYDRLKGEIPPELGELSNLKALELHGHRLTGEIPPELGDLSNLESLRLGGNRLTGEIPPELGELSNLVSLDLHGNWLTGEIPPELGDLSNLEWLALSGNSLTGGIPPELGDLSNLDELELGGNSLTGEIPPELRNLSNLKWLFLYSNSLTGEIPPGLGELSSLELLHLYENSLTGEIPVDFLDLSLRVFDWDDNDGLCAPSTSEFDDWLDRMDRRRWRGPRCD